jgi:hypothetical protein
MRQINSDIKIPIIHRVICITRVESEIVKIGQYIPNNS